MTIIGITGSFGTGKTTVTRMFKDLGAIVFDADKIAHEALLKKCASAPAPQCPSYKKLVKIFGKKILGKNREIDRRKLGDIVFKDKLLLEKLNSVVHPYVIKRIKKDMEGIKRKTPDAVIILDVPLLIEAGLLDLIDKLIVVKTDRKTQIKRCRKKTGLGAKEVLARIKVQMPMTEKIRFSDFVIDNSGKKEQTKREAGKIWEEIQRQIVQKKRIWK